jgi:hypothetical protein
MGLPALIRLGIAPKITKRSRDALHAHLETNEEVVASMAAFHEMPARLW